MRPLWLVLGVVVGVPALAALAAGRGARPVLARTTTTTTTTPTGSDADDDAEDADDENAAMAKYWRSVERAMADGSAERQEMMVEGDILNLPPAGLRNANVDPRSKWPNNEVVLKLAPGEWPPRDLALLEDAIRDLEHESCVRFVAHTNQTDYLLLKHTGHSCASLVGFHKGAGGVPAFLGGLACLRRGTIQHELLHTLGMWHEHTRPDRDDHVSVLWQNVQPERRPNFLRRPPGTVQTLGLPYDYGSVMHYRTIAFSRNGLPTIVPRRPEGLAVMGQRRRFSPMDIAKLNTLYNCPAPYYRTASVYQERDTVGPGTLRWR